MNMVTLLLAFLGLWSFCIAYCPVTPNALDNNGMTTDCRSIGKECYDFAGEPSYIVDSESSFLPKWKSQTVQVIGCYDDDEMCKKAVANEVGHSGSVILTKCRYRILEPKRETCGVCYKNLIQIGDKYYENGDTCEAMTGQYHLFTTCPAGHSCMALKLVLMDSEGDRYIFNAYGCSDPQESESSKCRATLNQLDEASRTLYRECSVVPAAQMKTWAK